MRLLALEKLVDRSRLYVLIAALETDLRAILRDWVAPSKHEQDIFGGRYGILRERADKAGIPPTGSVLDYADFSEASK